MTLAKNTLFSPADLQNAKQLAMIFPAPIPAHKTVIMVHCLATKRSWAAGKTALEMVREVADWHVRENGWSAIAYAAIIDEQGYFALGRDLDNDGDVWEETGAGAVNHNRNVIHIALSGGHGSSANDAPEKNFTPVQLYTLRSFLIAIDRHAGRTLWKRGHNEVAAKACPGFQVKQWWESAPPRKITQSRTIQGSVLAGVGTLGGVVTEQAEALAPLTGISGTIQTVFVILTLAGIALTIYARVDDWKAGRQ